MLNMKQVEMVNYKVKHKQTDISLNELIKPKMNRN